MPPHLHTSPHHLCICSLHVLCTRSTTLLLCRVLSNLCPRASPTLPPPTGRMLRNHLHSYSTVTRLSSTATAHTPKEWGPSSPTTWSSHLPSTFVASNLATLQNTHNMVHKVEDFGPVIHCPSTQPYFSNMSLGFHNFRQSPNFRIRRLNKKSDDPRTFE